MDEDGSWGRGSDNAFGNTGVGTSKPENLHAWETNTNGDVITMSEGGSQNRAATHFWELALGRLLEKAWLGSGYGIRPLGISGEELCEGFVYWH